MAKLFRTNKAVSLVLVVACSGAAIAACGGDGTADGTDNGQFHPAGGAAGASAGGSSGKAGSSTGGSSTGGDGGGPIGGDAGSAGSTQSTLAIEPATATIEITDMTTPVTQAFVAKLNGTATDVKWTVDNLSLGDIGSTTGVFTTGGVLSGTAKVTATFGSVTAKADLTVKVKISQDVSAGAGDPGVNPANHTALEGTPMADPGTDPTTQTRILYPYNETVLPLGLAAPLLQFSPGNTPPEDAKIKLSSSLFSWEGYVHVANSGVPQFSIPQDIYDAAMSSSKGAKLTIDVTKAAAGVAYGPATTSVIVAPANLKGAVYYMTYEEPNNGLYSVRPGVNAPAELKLQGCNVCHAVSSNGSKLVVGEDSPEAVAPSGIYNVGSDGSFSKIIDTPADYLQDNAGPAGYDSRGLAYATFTPDGRYLMRSRNFWGGVDAQAWFIDDVANQLVPATVNGLGPTVSSLVPAISHDGKKYAFTMGAADTMPADATFIPGAPSRSLNVMDLAIDDTTHTLNFSGRKTVIDNGVDGEVVKFPTFLPDSSQMVVQEGTGYNTNYEMMLPTWDANSIYTGATGHLSLFDLTTSEKISLDKLNTGTNDIDKVRNYEPFSLPIPVGGYFWVVFTSIREYGNTYTVADSTQRKQIWVAAISVNHASGEDPSHPPFYLPNQSATKNERGFWALEPCRGLGVSCDTGDECCEGFCRPSDPNDASSPKVCQTPPAGQCSQVAEACTTTADCCGAATGVTCIGGFCTEEVGPIQ